MPTDDDVELTRVGQVLREEWIPKSGALDDLEVQLDTTEVFWLGYPAPEGREAAVSDDHLRQEIAGLGKRALAYMTTHMRRPEFIVSPQAQELRDIFDAFERIKKKYDAEEP